MGLDANFYNNVCLPLFTVLLALLVARPWLKWQGGLRDWKSFLITGAAFFGALVVFWKVGVTKALPLMSASLCAAILASMVMLLTEKSTRSWRPAIMACLVHISVALMALGISFSGPYKQEVEVELARGQVTQVGPYSVTLSNMYEGRGVNFDYIEAELQVSKDGKVVSVLSPQRRLYDKWQRSAFSEATTYPSLGSEFYATLLGVSGDSAVLRMSANPLVNWLWIGGALMSIAPFIGLTRKRRPKSDKTTETA
jgi:cytochrome c-type biogenesis protein CcmF